MEPRDQGLGPSIDEVLSQFLVAQEQRLAERTFANYRSVVELLRHCLNGYGHQYLDDHERRRYEAALDAGDENAFVHLFGPEKIGEGMGEFLDYFIVRKVIAGEELLPTAGTVTKKLAKWMATNGYLDAAAAGEAVERGSSAARDLPRAERLSRLLFDQAQREAKDFGGVADDDIVEDYFTIERVEPGALWLTGGGGPVEGERGGQLTRPSWMVRVPRPGQDSSGLEVARVGQRLSIGGGALSPAIVGAVTERTCSCRSRAHQRPRRRRNRQLVCRALSGGTTGIVGELWTASGSESVPDAPISYG
ncbi:MAG: hypothetical protein M3P85_07415 [Actinomycetota bacterium]|nr:hypothetical protein [Actinomycetota bacterium]